MKTTPEILIYIKKIRDYFEKGQPKDREYFYNDENKDVFYKKVEELANKNFEEKGTPELTQEQFKSIALENKITNKGKNWVEYLKIGVIYLN